MSKEMTQEETLQNASLICSHTRLSIMGYLSSVQNGARPTDIAHGLGIRQSVVSDNIQILFTCGLVKRSQSGSNALYEINPEGRDSFIKNLSLFLGA